MAGQIFVSIASYRDNQCQYTIQDLFRKAKFPKRVIVGVCFQVSKDDTDNFLLDLDPWCGQIRSHFVEHSAAKGPCIARAWTQDLYRGEEYYFQIDSHMRFVQNWDVLCIQQLQQCKTPKAILTTYASSYTLPKTYIAGAPDCAELAPNKALPILCADRFGDENQDDPFLRIKTRSCRKDFESPPPALFWTARFAFSRGEVVQDVPYDPHLEYVFFGEEISMSARLWTSGWDFFHPTSEIAYHLASRAHRYWFREVQSTPEQLHREKQGKFRVCGLLGTPWPDHHLPPEKPYGVGSQRTLAEYEDFAGVRFADCILEPRATLGGQPAQLFAPLWADEQREKMLLTNQLKDIESWAGKGNLSEANLDFVKKVHGYEKQNRQEAQMRDVARMRIDALLSKLPGAEVELELCKAFANLAQLEHGNGEPAAGAVAQAAHYLSLAKGAKSTALWEASTAVAEASVRMAQHDFAAAKVVLLSAADALGEALETGHEALQVTQDIMEAIHRCHERTDDRKGLEKYHASLKATLEALRRLQPETPEEVPSLTAACPPPQDAGDVPSVLAVLLERMVLLLVATGRERDMDLVKTIYESFQVARESPGLLRLLAMLQSSGNLLKTK